MAMVIIKNILVPMQILNNYDYKKIYSPNITPVGETLNISIQMFNTRTYTRWSKTKLIEKSTLALLESNFYEMMIKQKVPNELRLIARVFSLSLTVFHG